MWHGVRACAGEIVGVRYNSLAGNHKQLHAILREMHGSEYGSQTSRGGSCRRAYYLDKDCQSKGSSVD
jgi:hypothetical protein